MRSKQIIALATFFTCFILSSFLVGFISDISTSENDLYKVVTVKTAPENASSKITALLLQDKFNGAKRYADLLKLSGEDESFLTIADKSQITSEYVKNSGSIDDSSLPREFQTAWRNHIKAWANYSDFLNKAERAGLDAEDIESIEDEYTNDINSTWFEVLRLGNEYGSDFSE